VKNLLFTLVTTSLIGTIIYLSTDISPAKVIEGGGKFMQHFAVCEFCSDDENNVLECPQIRKMIPGLRDPHQLKTGFLRSN
jgi:hypothetical protein